MKYRQDRRPDVYFGSSPPEIFPKYTKNKIFIDFNFKKSGEAKIKNISNSNNDDYLKSIFDLFEKDSTGLPKFYPAVKRGQEVDVVFEFPLILYTN